MSLETKLDREFRKDLDRDRQSGCYKQKDFEKLKEAIDALIEEVPLDKNLLDHQLKGNWFGYRECHVKPDWLLVYKTDKDSNTLNLARLGSHNQIFNK
jgi:mRNA interferase YafQ